MNREPSLPATGRLPASSFRRFTITAALALVCLLAGARPSLAQKVEDTKNTPDAGLRGEMRVDPSTLALGFQLSLGNYPGRAGGSLPVTVSYSSKVWRINFQDITNQAVPRSRAVPKYAEHSASGWTTNMDVPTLEGMEWQPYDALGGGMCASPSCPPPDPTSATLYVYRLLAHMPDGSTHELRRDDTPTTTHASGNNVYYSVDGSRMRYEEAADKLFLPDGSRYDNLRVPTNGVRFVDRNGNTLTYSQGTKQWTDTLGRAVGRPPLAATSSGYVTYTIPGVGNEPMTYRFRWRNLSEVLSGGQALRYTGDRTLSMPMQTLSPSLFQSQPVPQEYVCTETEALFNPVVLSEVELPDGTRYAFTYNEWGEIDKVVYPTGGYERYVYAPVDGISSSLKRAGYAQGNRGVVDRYVSATGAASDEAHWHYAATNNGFTTPYKVTITAPDQTRTERLLHGGSNEDSRFGFDDARNGMAYDERVYSAAGQMLRRTLTEWDKSGALPGGEWSASRNPRVIKQVEIIADTGGDALTATTTYEYDQDLNVTRTRRYGFAVVSQATAAGGAIGEMPVPAQPVRTDEATYLVNDASLPQATRDAYRARNMVGLLTSTQVKDASVVVARSEVRYDETDRAPLPCGATVGWTDPGAAVRGSATTTRNWLDTTGTWLETHAQFDACGSPRKSWDAHYENAAAHGRVSEVIYDDAFYAGGSRNTYAYPTKTISAVPDPTGQHGSGTPLTTSTVYDFWTGRVTSTTDANNVATSFAYEDPFNRLTQTVRAVGTAAQAETTVDYDGVNRTVTMTSDQNVYGDNRLKVVTVYDGLGRTVETRSYETETAYISTTTVYDTMGRPYLVSHPSRGQGATTDGWTRASFDELGRIKEVATFAGAALPPDTGTNSSCNGVITTTYTGNTTRVTDQAGRARRSVRDALGNLTRVDEPDAATGNLDDGNGNPVQYTSYTYDTLGNLRTVSQGGQQRVFNYDSIGRLKSANNPESGVTTYTYDENNNLKTKTDGRGTTATYDYDALNRNITISYTTAGGAAQTLPVNRYYDNPAPGAYGRGRPWKSKAEQSTLKTMESYDPLGRLVRQKTQFWVNGAWGAQEFATQLGYNLAGNITSLIYPSQHAVSYNYDAAGRLADYNGQAAFSGNLGDGTPRVYASEVLYDQAGGMSQERFGTDTPLYHKLLYNSRAQLAEIRLGTAGLPDTGWQRGAIINNYSTTGWGASGGGLDNNGNLKRQELFIPNIEGPGYDQNWSGTTQNYSYDYLNRLKVATEQGGGGSWTQTYRYDVWGNRTIDLGQSTNVPAVQYDFERGDLPNTNRLYAPGDLAYSDPNDARRRMRYDGAGNLTYDGYTGAGTRSYDAENRMVSAQTGPSQTTDYAYDADGLRVRRGSGAGAVWQVYGPGGDLLAEYAYDSLPNQPQKEYGYRRSAVLVVATASTGASAAAPTGLGVVAASDGPIDLTWATSGASNYRVERGTRASSTAPVQYATAGLSQTGAFSDTGVSHGTAYLYRVCAANSSGNCISAYSNLVVATAYTFTDSPLVSYTDHQQGLNLGLPLTSIRAVHITELREAVDAVRRLAGLGVAQWAVPSQSLQGDLVRASHVQELRDRLGEALSALGVAAPTYTDPGLGNAPAGTVTIKGAHFKELRQAATRGVGGGGGGGAGPAVTPIEWLVADQLGTPRMSVDKSGSLAGVTRHDYLPFGEEAASDASWRTPAHGYAGDNVRQKFTSKERDSETGLDYFGARYYGSAQGRFTAPDPLLNSGRLGIPQSWNRYTYTLNNPLKYVDPDGLYVWGASLGGGASDNDVSEEIRRRRNLFRATLAKDIKNLEAIKKEYGEKSSEYENAVKAVGAYGTENVDKKNVFVGVIDDSKQSFAGNTTAKDKNGNVYVTFKKSYFDRGLAAGGGEMDTSYMEGLAAHEGWHVAETMAGVKLGTWDSESGGLTVQAVMGTATYTNGNAYWPLGKGENRREVIFWDTSWAAADRATLRSKAVKQVLEAPTADGGYGLTEPKKK